jgi:hypothetical protein
MSLPSSSFPDYFDLSARLIEEAGLGELKSLAPVPGGGNNRVLLASVATGTQFLVKAYFHSAGDQRNRFLHEKAFYNLASEANLECVPKILAWNESARLGLFEFIEGRKLTAAEIGTEPVLACGHFFATLNSYRETLSGRCMPVASEACFSISDHAAVIQLRVDRLTAALSDPLMDPDVAKWILNVLLPKWIEIRESLAREDSSNGLQHPTLAPALRCISPSDFGFHNALQTNRGLVFFDFEYAGWDDPAKMACDFFCQPELPIPPCEFDSFRSATLLPNWEPDTYASRIRLLLPAYRVKWACIILNVFLSCQVARRNFADPSLASPEARQSQWAKAQRQILLANSDH